MKYDIACPGFKPPADNDRRLKILGNSNYYAQWCFNLGIQLKRIEVIADDEAEIVEAVRRMSDAYDMVVTSGGIGVSCSFSLS